jgi:hypothetical protein
MAQATTGYAWTSGEVVTPAKLNQMVNSATVNNIQAADIAGIAATGSTAARTLPDRFADTINVKDFGAVGNGVADDTAAIQAALNAADNKHVVVPAGEYKCTSRLTMPDGCVISGYGATLNFSQGNNDARVSVSGTVNATVALSADAGRGATSLSVANATGIAGGDVLLVSSSALVPGGAFGISSDTLGEFVKVRNVSGQTIHLDGALNDAYAVVNSASVKTINWKRNIGIYGLKIIGAGPSGANTSTNDRGISALYCKDLTIKDCVVERCDYNGIRVDQSYNVVIDGCFVYHAYRGNDSFASVIQYGIAILGATSHLKVVNNTTVGGKHGIAWSENINDGVGRDHIVSGNTISGTWSSAIATHESNEQFIISNNIISGCARGLDIRVRRAIVSNNIIRQLGNGSISDGIYLSQVASDVAICNNTISDVRNGIRMYNVGLPADVDPFRVVISGNIIQDVTQVGVFLQQTGNSGDFSTFVVSGNTINDCAGDSIRFDGPFYSPAVIGNYIRNAVAGVGYAVRLAGTSRAQVTGNYFDGMVPLRLENDTQATPVAPQFTIAHHNTWDHTTGFSSVVSGADFVIQDNVEVGTTRPGIVSGAITVPSGVRQIFIDTEGLAATDDLDTISGGGTGNMIVLSAASDARTVVLKDNTGNLRLAGDFSLDALTDRIVLINTGAGYAEVCRSNNDA